MVSVDDLDKLMPHGLGLRYAFLGALETSYLNANGKLRPDVWECHGDALIRVDT